MVVIRGVQIGTMYKLLGKVDTNECVNTTITETKISSYLVNMTMVWHQCIHEEKVFMLCIEKVWFKVFLISLLKSILVNNVFMEKRIM